MRILINTLSHPVIERATCNRSSEGLLYRVLTFRQAKNLLCVIAGVTTVMAWTLVSGIYANILGPEHRFPLHSYLEGSAQVLGVAGSDVALVSLRHVLTGQSPVTIVVYQVE